MSAVGWLEVEALTFCFCNLKLLYIMYITIVSLKLCVFTALGNLSVSASHSIHILSHPPTNYCLHFHTAISIPELLCG